jgi:hypothetical protein
MTGSKDDQEAVRQRNLGLKQEQQRLRDPDHLTPEEESPVPDPEPPPLTTNDQDNGGSTERMHNPPQVKGPREDQNDMV